MNADNPKSVSTIDPGISITDILESAPVGFLIFDANGFIKSVTSNFFAFGIVQPTYNKSITGKSLIRENVFLNFSVEKEIKELLDGDAFEKVVLKKKSVNGDEVSILLKGTPLYVKNEIKGGILVVEDVRHDGNGSGEQLEFSNQFHNLIQGISDYFLIVDLQGEILFKPTAGFPGTSEFLADKFKKNKANLFSLGDEKILHNLLNEINETHKPAIKEMKFGKKGDERIFRIVFIPSVSGLKTVTFAVIIFKDITNLAGEKNIIENEIQELRKYQAIATTLMDAIIVTDISGKINFWNEQSAKLFGYNRSEIHGKMIGKIIPDIDKNFIDSLIADLKDDNIWEGQLKIGRDEDEIVLLTRIGIIGEEENKSMVILCNSITDRARSEKNLKLSEEKYRNIVTNTHEYICTLDLKGKITYANPHFVNSFGYTDEELLKLNFKDLISEQYFISNEFNIDIKSVTKLESTELPLITKDKRDIYVLASFTTVRDLNGKAKYFNVVLTDISQKKDSQKDLLLVRSVFDASQEGIIVVLKRKLILANEFFVKMFGYENVDEVLGKDPLDFVNEKDIPKIAKYIQASENGKESAARYDFIGKKKDEQTFYVENSSTTYEMDGGIYLVSVLRDVTESRKAKQLIEESEARYRNISDNIDECMWTAERVDGRMKVVFYTAAIKKITGYSYKEFIDNPKLWVNITHPDDTKEMVTRFKRLYRDSGRNFEEMEYRIINKLGNTIWIRNKITILRDEEGSANKIFGLVSDISISKKAEADLHHFTENLKQLNETKDRFLSIISHDLRTPFSSIIGFTDLLLKDSKLQDEKQRQYVTFIKESSANMLGLVNSLLDWTRLQTGRIKFEPERINSKIVAMKSIQMLAGSAIQKEIELTSKIETDLFVHADEALMMQVFNNLIGNAIKFTKPGGHIWITAEPVIEKKYILFSVRDDGIGIKDADKEKLFRVDTKFTSAGTSGEKGSGLGLSLVKDIVNKHGGNIWVESELGKGTEFFFSIPISSTRILLVDDFTTDRLLYTKLLKSFLPDYTIDEATNGKEAFDMLGKATYALVISDHKMPVMSGYDLVKQINLSDLKFKPPVIVLSADIIETIRNEYEDLGVEFIFRKPVNLAEFKDALDKSLKKAIINSFA